jgi:hypothetical protein
MGCGGIEKAATLRLHRVETESQGREHDQRDGSAHQDLSFVGGIEPPNDFR